MAGGTVGTVEALESAWHDVFVQLHPMIDLVARLLELTDVGAHPVGVDELAAALGLSADDTERLIGDLKWPWVTAESSNGVARIKLVGDSANPRYWYRFGDRRIGVGGCAPDAFIAAMTLGRPMRLETVCPVTKVPIRVDFRGDGTVVADPSSAVVGVIDPPTASEALDFTDAERIDEDICSQQPLLASPDAASGWLKRHPGGAAVPVSQAHEMLKRLVGRS